MNNGHVITFALEDKEVDSPDKLNQFYQQKDIASDDHSAGNPTREVEFTTQLHNSAKRDYVARVTDFDKAACSIVAKKFESDYWDGDRQYGYGGYQYDGRWKNIAEKMIAHYSLEGDARILDIGCGKGYLLYEFKKLLPNSKVCGIDISKYAIDNAHPEIKENLINGNANDLPFSDNSFDLVISNTTLHNLKIYDLVTSLNEINRVMKKKAWICVESYRNEVEKMNLLYWQLTCESFYSTDEWKWIYEKNHYKGDYQFIYFE